MAHHLHPLITNLPAEACVRKHVLRGNFLFRQQQAATAIFAVESGRLRLFRDLSDGSSVTLHVAREQETFAEASLFSSHYHCHAQAELDSVVVCVDAQMLMQELNVQPELNLNFSRLLAAHVRELRAMLSLRDIRSADERLMAWLRLRASSESMTVVTDRPWTAIAEELGLTREAVYRSLARLEGHGCLQRQNGRITLR